MPNEHISDTFVPPKFAMPEYGSGYVKSPLGILKIAEIVLCLVVLILDVLTTRDFYYYDDMYTIVLAAAAFGLVISLLILILSCVCGDDVDAVLKWQFFVHILMAIWFLTCCIILICADYGTKTLILSIIGVVAGIFYIVDAILSYKDYKPL